MTIKECYDSFGGNYNDVILRLRTEERIEKYITKFLNDQSFANLQNALEQHNTEEAFRAAHTLKGVAQNMGFDRLASSAQLITEKLREGDMIQANQLFFQVNDDYNLTISSIRAINKSSI